MPTSKPRHPALPAAIAAALLHAVAVWIVWRRHGAGPGGLILFWMDFPVSLLYGALQGRAFWVASYLAGGALWATAAALFTLFVGRIAKR
ncbi:MAG: hypothetical protein KDB94_12805 [Acidobacteria bacterium]|nr:hypothetical protein [Acidobacteriota bacterium]